MAEGRFCHLLAISRNELCKLAKQKQDESDRFDCRQSLHGKYPKNLFLAKRVGLLLWTLCRPRDPFLSR